MVALKKGDIRVFKVIVIGDSAVGKTCLTCRFCCGKFPVKTEVTIGVDFREKCVEIEGETIKLQFWDTAGQERFRKSMIQHYYRGVHAVVFVYDITSLASFESLPAWIAECEKHNLNSVPRILIGNKVDTGEQRVNTQIAQKFADAHNMPLFETSALDDSSANHVESIFLTLALKLKASKPMMTNNSNNDLSGRSVSVPPSIVLHRADVTGVEHNSGDDDNSGSCMC